MARWASGYDTPQRPYALLPEGHRFAGQKEVSLRDLALEPMILLDASQLLSSER